MANYVPAGNVRKKQRARLSHPDKMDFPTTRQNLNSVVSRAIPGKGDAAVKGTKVGGQTRLRGGRV